MPKFVLSDLAPEGHKKFSFGADEVEAPFETDDPILAGNARVHPWLEEEVDTEASTPPPSYVNHLDPKDDVMSAHNSIANDPKAVEEALKERGIVFEQRTALDADLDQNKKVETAGVSETVAALDASDPKPSKKGPTAAKSGKE